MYGTTSTDPALGVAVVALLAAVHARDAIRERWPDRWPWESQETAQDALRRRYIEGEIDEPEFEAELDLLMDESNERIQERVEPVEGIGPVVAKEIALSFKSVGHLERADRADLMDVEDVGPVLADRILDSL